MQKMCPITTNPRKCAIVSYDLINEIGDNVSKAVTESDMIKLVNMSDSVLYNESDSMRGAIKTMAVNLSNSSSWLRLNVSRIAKGKINEVLHFLNCK